MEPVAKVAVLVDAGYFWVQTTHVVKGQKESRESVAVNFPSLHAEVLGLVAQQFPAAHLLRVYWYDGPGPRGKADSHRSIEELDDFKLRLGTRNGQGDQKAVDGLIIADLIGLAQTRAIDYALLVSGDADLTPGVIAAQSLGIRVHLLTLGPASATSPFLRAEVDLKAHWADDIIKKFACPSEPVPEGSSLPQGVPGGITGCLDPLESVARDTLADLGSDGAKDFSQNGQINPEIDRQLLSNARKMLGRKLTDDERRHLRAAFKSQLPK
jgi:hypothetical protein